jgi:glycosyltransferase involved in cell wall biosynthesis
MKHIFFSESSINIGGQELQALQQMQALNRLGYQTILLCKPHSAILLRAQSAGLKCFSVDFRNTFHLPSILKVVKFIFQFRPLAFLSHGSRDALIAVIAVNLVRYMGIPAAAVFRIKTFQHGHPLSFAYNYLFSKTLTPSHYLRDKLLLNHWIHPSQVETLYPGIDFSTLDGRLYQLPIQVQDWLDTHAGPVISHGAILRGEKGHSTILKALVLVRKVFPNVRYLIAGEGQDKPLLEAEIAALGLNENVLLTGLLKNIAPLLRKSDLAVLPSLVEPLGMFQIEAQYLEVPTIASRVGGIPETMLHQKTGLILEPGNVEQWANAIIWMLSNPNAAKQMAKAGKKMVIEKFSLHTNTNRLIGLLEQN